MQELQPPSTGLVAGKYELVRLIGQGGMGSVWEGRHASLGTRVAVKFIDAQYASSDEARKRFDNEARAAATIQSKHAIQIYDHGVTHDGKPYIVMELLLGEPLDKRLERLGRLSLEGTARLLQQVSRALQRAHDHGIVHRDLKPENIFLVKTPDDDEEIAKVLDFGIAKMKPTNQPGVATSSTKTGAVLGTPFYMSPEQARGLRNVDHRTDVWSLGVIVYRCIVGVLPFEGESVGDLLVKICTAPLPVPSQVLPGLPPAFDAWFARVLERDPERRFPSAQSAAESLVAIAGLGGYRPISGDFAPPPLPPGARAYTPAGPAVFASSGERSGAPFVGTSAPFTASAPPPKSGGRAVVLAGTIGVLAVVAIAGGFAWMRRADGPAAGRGASSTVVKSSGLVAPVTPGSTAPPAVDTLPPLDPTPPAHAGETHPTEHPAHPGGAVDPKKPPPPPVAPPLPTPQTKPAPPPPPVFPIPSATPSAKPPAVRPPPPKKRPDDDPGY